MPSSCLYQYDNYGREDGDTSLKHEEQETQAKHNSKQCEICKLE